MSVPMSPKNLLAGVVLGIALAAGIWLYLSTTQTPATPVAMTVLPSGTPLPAFSLLDDGGEPIDESVFRGRWDLVFFGFTHCPDVCPLTLQVLAAARAKLEESGVSPLPRIVLVSVDPERDTPQRISQYLASFGDDTLGITGDLAGIRTLTSELGIFFEKRGDGESYTVDHSAVVLVIDPQGRFHALFGSPHRIENYVHDLPLLLTS